MSLGDQLGLTFQPAARRIWTVRDLMAAVRTQLEREYTDVWVEAEISNYRPAESGHLYFTLKDGDAQMRAVMFRTQARLLRFRPENGLQVVARGRITVFEARGEMQILLEYLEPKGAGALQVAFEQLKAKLAKEGLFDAARKKPLPALPRRIGVVTSPRGAAIQDMLNVLRRRHESVNILIYPAQVQGESASTEVISGIRYFNRERNVDVIIIARGGGSLEDLAAFNDEAMARTVAGSKLPVISAVGHETDFTIIDFVADLRAPTPSAAAELVVKSKHELDEKLESLHRRLTRAARYQVLHAKQRLTQLTQHASFARMRDSIARRQQRLDELTFRLRHGSGGYLRSYARLLDGLSARMRHHDPRARLASIARKLDALHVRLLTAINARLQSRRARRDRVSAQLIALSPTKVLERGYALVFDADGNLLKDAGQVKVGDKISAQLAHGTLGATVDRKD